MLLGSNHSENIPNTSHMLNFKSPVQTRPKYLADGDTPPKVGYPMDIAGIATWGQKNRSISHRKDSHQNINPLPQQISIQHIAVVIPIA